MPKRKAASVENQVGADETKRLRASSAAAAAESNGFFESAVARANLAPRIAAHTLKLIHALKATDGSHTPRMQAVVDLLKQDACRPDSLLDLSLIAEGEKVSGHWRRRHGCNRSALIHS